MIERIDKQTALQELGWIFKKILPAAGLPERPAQLELSQRMLDAMLDRHIALCEAGTGIGKTYAYLTAAIVYNKYRKLAGWPVKPVCISTCSIALQEAIVNEYLPTLNRALLRAGMLERPAMAAIRKGKTHYVCDQRLKRRLQTVDRQQKNPRELAALKSMQKLLDMDGASHLSSFDKRQICVPRSCTCKKESCRYLGYLDSCSSERYAIQICNHNLLLADAVHRGTGKKPVLPDCCCVIIDEAHKLPDIAREMFGYTLSAADIEDMAAMLLGEGYQLAAEELTNSAVELVAMLNKPWDETAEVNAFMKPVEKMARKLKVIKRNLQGILRQGIKNRLCELADFCDWFLSRPKQLLLYTAAAEDDGIHLGISPLNIGWLLGYRLWNRQMPIVLTSGTLSVAGDFRRFRNAAGLLQRYKVRESVAESPFDYEKNCLLYLPEKCPAIHSEKYLDDMAVAIKQLLQAARGHALALFTSYLDLAGVKECFEDKGMDFPLFIMGRNRLDMAERFRAQSGGVMLAAGAAWEGMDFPGDCVSLLVIPRLPFPFPDAKAEQEQAEYESLSDYIKTVVVPDMQIKLRQGFGRAIRTETDSCVVAVLDERAAKDHGRYFEAMQEALPAMPITGSLAEVEKFIKAVKPESYFAEASHAEC